MKVVRRLAAMLSVATLCTGGVPEARADGYSWSGFYVGVHAGAAWSDTTWDNITLTGERVTFSDSGFIGGGHVGLQHQFGRIVAGVELSYSGLGLDDRAVSGVNPAVTYSTHVRDLFAASGRLGYAADAFLLYVKGGYANARVRYAGANAAIDSFAVSHRTDGYLLGAGIEWKLQSNLILGLEYDFVNLGSDNFTGVSRAGIPFVGVNADTEIHSLMARLSYKFGRDHTDYSPMK